MTLADLFGLTESPALLEQALTHPSYANENKGAADNQRFEFLGDAVLGLCTSELLCERFPDADEGTLTRMRAQLVNAEALAGWARENNVAEAIRMGKGASLAGLANTVNVLADAVEALIAASFLAQGLEGARRVCRCIVDGQLAALSRPGERDPKSDLQERVQAAKFSAPAYQVLLTEGPAHERHFEIAVSVDGFELARGQGRSKRAAERSAAARALAEEAWRALPLSAGSVDASDGRATFANAEAAADAPPSAAQEASTTQ